MGLLYDRFILAVVIFSVAFQLVAWPVFVSGKAQVQMWHLPNNDGNHMMSEIKRRTWI